MLKSWTATFSALTITHQFTLEPVLDSCRAPSSGELNTGVVFFFYALFYYFFSMLQCAEGYTYLLLYFLLMCSPVTCYWPEYLAQGQGSLDLPSFPPFSGKIHAFWLSQKGTTSTFHLLTKTPVHRND